MFFLALLRDISHLKVYFSQENESFLDKKNKCIFMIVHLTLTSHALMRCIELHIYVYVNSLKIEEDRIEVH